MARSLYSLWTAVVLVYSTSFIEHVYSQPAIEHAIPCNSSKQCSASHFCAFGPVSGWCTTCALVCTECGEPLHSPMCHQVCPDFNIIEYQEDTATTSSISVTPSGNIETEATTATLCPNKEQDNVLLYRVIIAILSILIIGLVVFLCRRKSKKEKEILQQISLFYGRMRNILCRTRDTTNDARQNEQVEAVDLLIGRPDTVAPANEPKSINHDEADIAVIVEASRDPPGPPNVIAPQSIDYIMNIRSDETVQLNPD